MVRGTAAAASEKVLGLKEATVTKVKYATSVVSDKATEYKALALASKPVVMVRETTTAGSEKVFRFKAEAVAKANHFAGRV